jgi:hypothetical protein
MKIMPFFLWTLASLVAYAIGLVLVIRVTPLLLLRNYDGGLFMGIAALDLMGGMLAFSAIVVTLAVFNGEIAIRAMDFLLLLGILFVAGRMSLRSFRSQRLVDRVPLSCILAGTYGVLLSLAALYYMVLLFK